MSVVLRLRGRRGESSNDGRRRYVEPRDTGDWRRRRRAPPVERCTKHSAPWRTHHQHDHHVAVSRQPPQHKTQPRRRRFDRPTSRDHTVDLSVSARLRLTLYSDKRSCSPLDFTTL